MGGGDDESKQAMAERFLAAATHIPCGFYSLVSVKYVERE